MSVAGHSPTKKGEYVSPSSALMVMTRANWSCLLTSTIASTDRIISKWHTQKVFE